MKFTIIMLITALSFVGATIIEPYYQPLPVDIETSRQASVNGKYMYLLHIIEAPEDKLEYGSFCDWGYWYGDEYAHHTNLTPGFWVYVYPNWYIWEKLAVEDKLDPAASGHGKYFRLMHVLHVPEDVRTYGAVYDWGFSEEYSYAGYENLTPGYWVYMKPNWYVWADVINIGEGGT